ncbi:hypothetical protein [Halobaculum sp. EA56]|uniref:hypothetical protein n=1 Tax=Halobaculum sp. EA56 TaxID=3421648 RepID=UPI003EB6ECFE
MQKMLDHSWEAIPDTEREVVLGDVEARLRDGLYAATEQELYADRSRLRIEAHRTG